GSRLTPRALVGAPLVAVFYGEPRVEAVLRALSLVFPIPAARVVPLAVLERRLAFRRLSLFELSSTVIGSAAGISAAVMGLGVWGLVTQVLAGSLSLTLLVLLGGWGPHLRIGARAAGHGTACALK